MLFSLVCHMWNFHCVYLSASSLYYPSPFPSPWSVIRGTSTMLAPHLTLLLTLFSDQDLASVELLRCQAETVSLLGFFLSILLVFFMKSSVSIVCAMMHHCLCCNIMFWTARCAWSEYNMQFLNIFQPVPVWGSHFLSSEKYLRGWEIRQIEPQNDTQTTEEICDLRIRSAEGYNSLHLLWPIIWSDDRLFGGSEHMTLISESYSKTSLTSAQVYTHIHNSHSRLVSKKIL